MEWEEEAREKGLVAATSDANGFVKVPMWKSATHLLVFADGYCPRIFRPKPASDPSSAKGFIFELDQGATIYGVVLQDGILRKDVDIRLTSGDLLASGVLFDETPSPNEVWAEWWASTDAEGRYELGFLPVGKLLDCSLELEEESPLPRERSLVLKAGERRELVWKLGGGCRLTGRVSDEKGNPLAFMQVKAAPVEKRENAFGNAVWVSSGRSDRGLFAHTDNPGAYELEGLWPGTWSVTCLPPEAEPGSIPWAKALVTIRKGQAEAQADLIIPPRRILEGIVLTPSREPVEGASLICRGPGGEVSSVSTSMEGTFRFEVPDHGVYWVRGFPPASLSDRFSSSPWVSTEEPHEGIEVILRESGGLVLTIHGGPAKSDWIAHISLFPMDDNFFREANGNVEDGVVHIQDLLTGRWSVVVRAPGGRVGFLPEVKVQNPSSPVHRDVILGSAAHLRIVGKRPGATTYVQVLREGGILWAGPCTEGQPVELDLPAGEAVCASYSPSDSMNVSPLKWKPVVQKHLVLQAGAWQEVAF